MRILIFGQSATAGWGLDSPEQSWARLLATGDPSLEVEAVSFWPAGPRAMPFATRQLESTAPDTVVLSLNVYPCVVPVVAASVRARFGERAWRLYSQLEKRANALTFSPTTPRRANALARSAARRVLGARPLADPAEVTTVYADLLRLLARREDLRVVVVAEARFGSAVRARLPGLDAHIEAIQSPSREVAAAHYFTWIEIDLEVEAVGRDQCFLADGVHLSAAGHALYARLLLPALAG